MESPEHPADPDPAGDAMQGSANQSAEHLARLSTLVDQQAELIARQTRELQVIRGGLSYRVGDLVVHGLTSMAAAREVPRKTAGLVRDLRAKARTRRRAAQLAPAAAPPHPSQRARTEPTAFEQARAREHRERLAARPARDFVIAMVCDEFTYNCFSPECTIVPLTPTDWRAQLDRRPPDLLLVESTWSGVDSELRPWRAKIYASRHFPRENRQALLQILDYCRRRGIPTAFWNKEDPTHFGDETHNFAATARLFDHVFTTAEECVDRYRTELGVRSVSVLPFATQPRVFHPFGPQRRADDVVFAGSWYAQHAARSEEMAGILDRILGHGIDLTIYDRHFDDDNPIHTFPERFRPLLRPAITHAQTAEVYRGSRYGLNINTVTASRSMFARRVFELMSSGTLVLSNYSVGMDEAFGDLMLFVDADRPWPLDGRSRADEDALSRAALLEALEKHTYAHRLEQLLRELGLGRSQQPPGITYVHRIRSLDEVDPTLARFQEGRLSHDRALLVLDDRLGEAQAEAVVAARTSAEVGVAAGAALTRPGSLQGLVTSTQVAIMDERPYPPEPLLREALAHSSYLDRGWVSLEPADTYDIRLTRRPGERVVGRADRLAELLDGPDHELGGATYTIAQASAG